uniref:hypothetical protein n=1 Tax=Paenirhodobacter enshiensis TaxID=1105367 RepID=UPI0035B0BA95
MKLMIAPMVLAVLCACTPSPQVVSDYNGYSVRLTGEGREPDPDTVRNAERICASRGLGTEYASSTYSRDSLGPTSHLFLCIGARASSSAAAPMVIRGPAARAGESYFSSAATM